MILSKATTDRLIFKPISQKDITVFYEAFVESFQDVTNYYRPAWSQYDDIPSKETMTDFITDQEQSLLSNKSYMFSVFNIETKSFIGLAELHSFDASVPKARLDYWVRTTEMKKGYATEMATALSYIGFDRLKCQRLEIRNDTRNKASGDIAKKIGYDFLTIFERNKQGKLGDFWDLEIYACLSKKALPPIKIEYTDDKS